MFSLAWWTFSSLNTSKQNSVLAALMEPIVKSVLSKANRNSLTYYIEIKYELRCKKVNALEPPYTVLNFFE